MNDYEDSNDELVRVTEERDKALALLADLERAAPIFAAARAYAEACAASRAVLAAWERADTPASHASVLRKRRDARRAEIDAGGVLREAALALHTDGGAK